MNSCILLIPNEIKKDIVELSRIKYYNYDIKFMSLREFRDRTTFSYGKKAIYNIMHKYEVKYSTATVYLDNLYYISDKLDNAKMQKLKEIKKYLEENNLLTKDELFLNYAKKTKIYIYGYENIDKYYLNLLKDFAYEIIEDEKPQYQVKTIYHFKDITSEVIYAANQICHLLKNNCPLSNIKLIASKEYYEVIDRIFKIYHIPVDIKKSSIYSIPLCKRVLANLDDAENILATISNENLKEKIINILNEYTFASPLSKAKDLIAEDMKKTYLQGDIEEVKLITLNSILSSSDNVFLLGFNNEHYPKIYYDKDYFSDYEKGIIGLSSSEELNAREKESTLAKLSRIKNLHLSYKDYDDSTTYSRSHLLEDIEDTEITNNDYRNSHMINKILLAEKLDNLVKYNILEDDLSLLLSNYTLPYLEYDNSYHKISQEKLYNFLDHKLTLSYTHLDNYNRCHFRYYIENILKLNLIEDDFAIVVGNICHEVLSNIDADDFTSDKYFDIAMSKVRPLTPKEEFFLGKIKEEMNFIVSTIKKQLEYTTFDKKMYEKKVYVNFDKTIKVTFMGIIDKVIYKEEDGKTYLVVIDYKTGNTDIKLKNADYGIGLQLPIYLYLSSNMHIQNVEIVGFYLQKLFTTNLDNKKDYDEERANSLKLDGYSTDNEKALSLFDKTYQDSKLIKSMKTTKNGFYSYSKVLSKEELNNLTAKTKDIINNTIDSILESDFSINPKIIDGENVSCTYCAYNDICYRREKDFTYINRESNHE